MKKIILTKGLPASGKDTWARELVLRNPGQYKRINKDMLREMLDGGKWSKNNEKFIIKMRNFMTEEALKDGKSVIISDTNFHSSHENTMKKIAANHNAHVKIESFLDVPLETCLERDLKRANSVGKDIIMGMYKQFIKKEAKIKPLNPMIFDKSLPYCVIFDLDGTLAHIHDRSPYDGKSCGSDLVNNSIVKLLNKYYYDEQEFLEVVILSGRNGESKPETEKWLADNKIYHHQLHMRKPGDSRKDSIIKKEIFDEHIKDKYNVLFVVDDRQQMVDTWRSMGLTCLQCNYGDF